MSSFQEKWISRLCFNSAQPLGRRQPPVLQWQSPLVLPWQGCSHYEQVSDLQLSSFQDETGVQGWTMCSVSLSEVSRLRSNYGAFGRKSRVISHPPLPCTPWVPLAGA